MSATCQTFFNTFRTTTLADAHKCADIFNVDGFLRCVLSAHPSQSGRDVFDIISVSSDTTTSSGETKVWRIDHPDVIDLQRNYPDIRFAPGDKIQISAGGCVQTGGSGATWKSYTHPTGDSADHLYSGLLWIPGVTGGGLQRIAGVLNRTFTVPDHLAPLVAQSLFLQLGYQDDGPGDNGYYSHDNGNNNQCLGVGPAYVEISVFKPKQVPAPVGVQWAPHSKPFDLTWNVNVPGDDNGLPLNPIWAYQISTPDGRPNFQNTCGPSFSGGDTVHDDTLSATCTSQMPTTDLFSESFPDSVWTAFGLCKSNLLQGHLNWAFVTYQGALEWRNAESGWPHDSDYNMGLITSHNAGETLLSDSDQAGVGLEFDAKETIDVFGSTFWGNFQNDSDAAKSALINGQPAVVTGLIGIDGVHGGYTEIHPVLSLAVLTNESVASDGKSVDETWGFFIRNEGDEGECSEQEHIWDGLPGGLYSIQLAWPDDATGVTIAGKSTDIFSSTTTSSTALSTGPTLEAGAPWTYLEFTMPKGQETDGVDGQITLHYTLKDGAKHHSRRMTLAAQKSVDEDVDWPAIERSALADPAKLATFDTMLRTAPVLPKLKRHAFRVDVSARIAVHHPRPDESRKGKLVRGHVAQSPFAAARDAALGKVFLEHRTEFRTVTDRR